MKNEAYNRAIEREEHYNAGVAAGIAFACDRFLSQLPADAYDEIIQKTIDYLIKEFHE